MTRLRLAAFASLLVASSPGWAAAYAFDVIYEGAGQAALAPGSTDPRLVTLQAGDTFSWTISALPGYRWSVLTGGDVFPMMAFGVAESAFRTSDHVLTLSSFGTTTLSLVSAAEVQSLVHMGTNEVTVPTGLVFDRLHLDYTLLSAYEAIQVADPNRPDDPDAFIEVPGDPIGSTPTTILPIFGMLDNTQVANTSITVYGPVPEPATWAFWLAGLAAAGVAAKRRRPA